MGEHACTLPYTCAAFGTKRCIATLHTQSRRPCAPQQPSIPEDGPLEARRGELDGGRVERVQRALEHLPARGGEMGGRQAASGMAGQPGRSCALSSTRQSTPVTCMPPQAHGDSISRSYRQPAITHQLQLHRRAAKAAPRLAHVLQTGMNEGAWCWQWQCVGGCIHLSLLPTIVTCIVGATCRV